jgi:hypothetical protein
MGFEVKDGTGTGNLARVDKENRLAVRAIQETEIEKAVLDGRAFNINTEFLPVSSSGENALLYVKNNEDDKLIVAAWFIGTGVNGGTITESSLVRTYFNPSGGTLIASASAVTPVNRNAGSSQVLLADCYKGGDGFTITGQDTPAVLYQTQNTTGRTFGNVFITLPKGSSLAVTYEPNGAEPINIYTGFQVYIESEFQE